MNRRSIMDWFQARFMGAALDVFEVEPPSDELRRKLIGLGNVICVPHVGASTSEGQKRVGLEMAKTIVEECRIMI